MFRNFKVHHDKVIRALQWLKENNCYYSDIIIDNKIIQFLPIDSSINNQLQHSQIIIEDKNKNEDNVIIHTFVSHIFLTHHEDVVIKSVLNCMQNKKHLIE